MGNLSDEQKERIYQTREKDLEVCLEFLFDKFKDDESTKSELLNLRRIVREILSVRHS